MRINHKNKFILVSYYRQMTTILHKSPTTLNCPRGFPIYEYENRLEKIQKLLIKNDISAMLVTDRANFVYFTGLVTRFWESPTRPLYLVIPNKGKPIVLVPDILHETMKRSWIEHIITWPAPVIKDDGVTELSKILKRVCKDNLGVPMDIETSLRMPLKHLLKVTFDNSLEMVDVTNLIRSVRIVKSDLEIQKIKYICQVTSKCFDNFANNVINIKRPTEADMVKKMNIMLLENGADEVRYIIGKSGINGYKSIVDGPNDDLLVPGAIFAIDTGAVHDEYFCDFNRNYVIVDSHKNNVDAKNIMTQYEEKHLILWEATEKGINMVKPGNRMCDIWKVMVDYFISKGIAPSNYSTGRLGHCLGIQLTELPSVVSDEYTVLKKGMVLCIEPFIPMENGSMVHEECVVVTDTGCELLTKRCDKKPYVINIDYSLDPMYNETYLPLQKRSNLSDDTLRAIETFKKLSKLCKKQIPTPLHSVKAIAKELNIKELCVKDEGQRLGLKSFKALGSLFATEMLSKSITCDTLCTMTDGNHGKGVAYTAQLMGMKAVIYVPKNMVKERIDAIKDLGAKVIVVNGNYDDSIEMVIKEAKENNWYLISDSSWDGYEDIPNYIVAGYSTIMKEIEEQRKHTEQIEQTEQIDPITHIAIQCGVGGLASAVAMWIQMRKIDCDVWHNDVKLIIVEPQDADCVAYNIYTQHNYPTTNLVQCLGDTNSIMAGLNCGVPSKNAWPVLRDISDLFVVIGDEWARIAMRKLYENSIISGESGGAGLAGIIANKDIFDENSVVLVINTEADTDPKTFKDICV